MKLSHIQKRLAYWYSSGQCFYITSPPGMGKTTVVQEAPAQISVALNKRIGFSYINGGNLTPMHLLGFGLPKHDYNGTSHSLMVFSKPFFWITSEGKFLEEYDGGIIFIDEADKMDVDCKKLAGEGAHSRRFGPHVLPPGWVVWMAGNRAQDRSGSTKELDHLINRRCEIAVTPDMDSLVDWMGKNGVMDVTIAFAENNVSIVFPDKLPEKQGPYCTPRSLVSLDAYMQILRAANNGKFPDDGDTVEEAAGRIGFDAAAQYFKTARLQFDLPTYEQVVKDPMAAKLPHAPDAQMLICYMLAHKVEAKDSGNVIKYVERLPKDFAATFAKAAVRRDAMIVTAPAFNRWAMQNSHLMNIINRV